MPSPPLSLPSRPSPPAPSLAAITLHPRARGRSNRPGFPVIRRSGAWCARSRPFDASERGERLIGVGKGKKAPSCSEVSSAAADTPPPPPPNNLILQTPHPHPPAFLTRRAALVGHRKPQPTHTDSFSVYVFSTRRTRPAARARFDSVPRSRRHPRRRFFWAPSACCRGAHRRSRFFFFFVRIFARG